MKSKTIYFQEWEKDKEVVVEIIKSGIKDGEHGVKWLLVPLIVSYVEFNILMTIKMIVDHKFAKKPD